MNNILNFELVEKTYGTHRFIDVFFNDFKLFKLVNFLLLFFIGVFISRKISKKSFKINKKMYLFLGIFYLIISIIKAYILSKLPPHDLEKDFCGIGYSIIQAIIMYHIPIIYTIIILAILGDKKIKDKRRDNKWVIMQEIMM